jgi:hypothetical protein
MANQLIYGLLGASLPSSSGKDSPCCKEILKPINSNLSVSLLDIRLLTNGLIFLNNREDSLEKK